jgi:hypothetical protein
MPIETQIMLGQLALQQEGTFGVVGLGLTVRSPAPEPMAIYALIYIPRDQQGEHSWRLQMTFADGRAVRLAAPVEGVPDDFVFENSDDVRGLELPALTTPLTAGPLISLPPFPLPPGREFLWRLWVDGETREGWAAPFRTTPPDPLTQRGRPLRRL